MISVKLDKIRSKLKEKQWNLIFVVNPFLKNTESIFSIEELTKEGIIDFQYRIRA